MLNDACDSQELLGVARMYPREDDIRARMVVAAGLKGFETHAVIKQGREKWR